MKRIRNNMTMCTINLLSIYLLICYKHRTQGTQKLLKMEKLLEKPNKVNSTNNKPLEQLAEPAYIKSWLCWPAFLYCSRAPVFIFEF